MCSHGYVQARQSSAARAWRAFRPLPSNFSAASTRRLNTRKRCAASGRRRSFASESDSSHARSIHVMAGIAPSDVLRLHAEQCYKMNIQMAARRMHQVIAHFSRTRDASSRRLLVAGGTHVPHRARVHAGGAWLLSQLLRARYPSTSSD